MYHRIFLHLLVIHFPPLVVTTKPGGGEYKTIIHSNCSVLPYVIYMARIRVSGLIFLSGAPGRIKYSVAHVYSMAWLISIFILDVLNMVSCFGDYVISIE